MSNKPTNIDLTKWRGVTFTNNSLKMDVFLINGASVPMASRPLGPIGKPAIFQNKPTQKPQKLKPIQSKRNFSRNRTGSVKGNRKSQVSNKRVHNCTNRYVHNQCLPIFLLPHMIFKSGQRIFEVLFEIIHN